MTDEALLGIIGTHNLPLHMQSVDQLGAGREQMRRLLAKGQPARQMAAKARSELIASRINEGGFSAPTVERLSQLLSSSSHLILSGGAPTPFQYLPNWAEADDSEYILRYGDNVLQNSISYLTGDDRILEGLHCFMKCQIMSGLLRRNALVIRNDESYIEHIEFVSQRFV